MTRTVEELVARAADEAVGLLQAPEHDNAPARQIAERVSGLARERPRA